MRAGNGEQLHAEVASVLDWWTLAGVDLAVGEARRDWLRPAPPLATTSDASAAPAEPGLPATLDGFLAWLATDGAAVLGPVAQRIAPAGDRAAALMVLIEMPAPEDDEAGRLLAGRAGRLFERMLAAIGERRESVWLAPFLPVRPAGGRADPERMAALAQIARHHVGLVAPRRLLVMGEACARLLLDQARPRGALHLIETAGGTIPAVATFTPQTLLGQPAMKPAAWADLRLLVKGDTG